jgi:uncharacterized protein
MNIKSFLMTCGLAVYLLAQPLEAGPLEDGRDAILRSDFATALQLLRPLAEQGDARAQGNLGFMYHQGYGVPQDFAEALKWLMPSAEQGDASSQDMLGAMYDNGDGVLQDFIQAHMWYNLSALNFKDSKSHYNAVTNRNREAAKMSPDQIAEAQRLAQEWQAAHQKK